MTKYLITVVLALLAGYGLLEARPLLLGPSVSVHIAQADSGLTTVSGRAMRAVAITLDGAPVLPDQNGSFSSTLALPSGGSILTLTATDRFGRSVTKTNTIYLP